MKYFDEEDAITEYEKQLQKKDKEIERLKQGYCELKEKCNKGECDCTHEEYNNMCEENIKMDLEIEKLTFESTKWESKFYDEAKKVDKAIEYIEVSIEEGNYFEDDIATDISEPTYDKYVNSNSLLDILKGVDKE